MEHDKVYVIDEHKCLREGMTKEQIKNETVGAEGAAGIPFGKRYVYNWEGETLSDPVEDTSDSYIVPQGKFAVTIDSEKRTFRKGDRIIVEGKCVLETPRALGIAVLTTGTPGDDTIPTSALTIQGTSYPCYSSGAYESMEFTITSDCEGYAALRIATGKEFEFKNPKIYVLRNDRCVNLQLGNTRVYPSTCEIIKRDDSEFPFVEYIGNREEHRFLNATVSSTITIRAELGGSEEFYAVIVSKISFAGTAADLIDVTSCKVVNGDLDVSEFTVVQITLYYDGFNICAVVSGY